MLADGRQVSSSIEVEWTPGVFELFAEVESLGDAGVAGAPADDARAPTDGGDDAAADAEGAGHGNAADAELDDAGIPDSQDASVPSPSNGTWVAVGRVDGVPDEKAECSSCVVRLRVTLCRTRQRLTDVGCVDSTGTVSPPKLFDLDGSASMSESGNLDLSIATPRLRLRAKRAVDLGWDGTECL